MYARSHIAKIITGKHRLSPILLFISRGLYDDEADPRALQIIKKKHTQFSRSPSHKALKACKTVIKATAYCLQNLGSELGVRCHLILFTEHLFIGFTYTADN